MFRKSQQLSNKFSSALLTMALTFTICGLPAIAGIESDPTLNKLEEKFFQHDYPKDDNDTRLDRLEKLIFGEAKTGDDATRLAKLVGAVPNLDAPADSVAPGGDNSSSASNPDDAPAPRSQKAAADPDAQAVDRERQITGGSQYPAVTAMEKKLLGKDYAAEPVVKRLERLETKVFGKATDNTDLSDRVDRLKAQTGIDLARTPPPGSDWADEEDGPISSGSELTFVPERRTAPKSSYNPDDDPMFNNRRAPARPNYGSAWAGGGGDITAGGSGSYGTRAPRNPVDDGYTPGGSYGSDPPRKVASLPPPTAGGIPRPAPDMVRGGGGASVPPAAMGLQQQVALLENELFRRSYSSETIPIRLNRLESTVFPGTRPSTEMSLPDRVRRLMSAVPLSGPGSENLSPQVAQGSSMPQTAPDYDPSGMPPVAPQRGTGGFSRIINGLGNLLMGGGSMGAYPVGSNLVQDPTTGMLIDRMTGNIIDPTTGVVVGRQGMGAPVQGYGGMGMGNGFNSGLSPIGSPYGAGSSMRFGFGGSGIRFGGGGMGMGSGMGMGGMGVGGYPIGTGTGGW